MEAERTVLDMKKPSKITKHVQDARRLIWSATALLLIAWFMTSMQIFSDESFARHTQKSPHWAKKSDIEWYWHDRLPDVFLALFLQSEHVAGFPVQAADWALNSFIVLAFLGSFKSCAGWMTCAADFLQLMAFNYLLRLFTMVATPLPPSDPRCPLNPRLNGLSFWEYLRDGAEVMLGLQRTCTDKLFSGHTATATTALYLIFRHTQMWPIRSYACLHYAVTLFLIVACQNHYTVDVLIGVMMAALTIKLIGKRQIAKKIEPGKGKGALVELPKCRYIGLELDSLV